ncbi:MAG: hypothetical protein ACI4ER_01555, partial [Suilimivivens sp.]
LNKRFFIIFLKSKCQRPAIEPECDPRDASAELGKELFERGVDVVVREVNRAWDEINQSIK